MPQPRTVKTFPAIPDELLEKARNGDKDAAWQVIEACSPVIRYAARRYKPRVKANDGDSFDELIATGQRAVFEDAIPRYEPGHGAKFQTYARYWIDLRIREEVYSYIPFGLSFKRTLDDLRKAEIRLFDELRREPKIEELAKELGASIQKIRALRFWELAIRGAPVEDFGKMPKPSSKLVDLSAGLVRRSARRVVLYRVRPLVARRKPILKLLVEHKDPDNGFHGEQTLEEIAHASGLRAPALRKAKQRFLAEQREHEQNLAGHQIGGCFFCEVEQALKAAGWSVEEVLEALEGR